MKYVAERHEEAEPLSEVLHDLHDDLTAFVKEYQEFVHGLWNSCEDATIGNQLTIDQSQLAADHLELVPVVEFTRE